ncbi:MAG: glutamate-5-semialdehyde dehydrogenase [Candidatus Puniceispirillum sp. TMED52]|nr:glutamate-5-semialdehyde dehydrogenase [SAR116 cluster bacterium]OUU46823.1 MAG: glutamate-5-semialdehyde dehydrogenase [Candidatus Puniceispirillum sp. TMED52]
MTEHDAKTDAKIAIARLTDHAHQARQHMYQATIDQRNLALLSAAKYIEAHMAELLAANAKDVDKARTAELTEAYIDRLTLTEDRIQGMINALRDIAGLNDPVGVELARWSRPNGLDISRISTPLGVLGVIFESRPNVTVDAAALAIKSANCVILRGGSSSINSAILLGDMMRHGLREAGLPEDAVQVIKDVDRALVGAMLTAQGGIDVIVPRGGRSLVERVQAEAKIPVFAHLEGICHIYVHADADPELAKSVVVNAKMRRTGICGAAETLLIDNAVINSIWPDIAAALRDARCQIRGDAATRAVCPWIDAATEDDFGHEFLDAIIAVKAVDHVDDAIAHIRQHGSDHTEAILTADADIAEYFVSQIDSSIVMINASTQFADGGEFGMGAELGIATGRIHARGPVSIEQLTCFKYIVRGNGQTRA